MYLKSDLLTNFVKRKSQITYIKYVQHIVIAQSQEQHQ